jgi:lipopolysaccharide assembly outer membrane protein LptD (OstA)
MNDVEAMFIDNINRKIEIRSNTARFNTISNNINFFGDVKVRYLNNLIFANKLDFNYKNNNIKIHENVIYKGNYGSVQADNMEINLTTKNLKLFMNNENDRVKIISNR